VRWRLLRELVRSDRTVRELTALTDEPQSLVSYHLRQLRDGRLVVNHRSAADRRDSYYAVDLTHYRRELQAAADALHPGVWPRPTAGRASLAPGRVLFLCTGNSARSQIAEALAEHLSGGSLRAASAGSHPKPLHANAVRVMRARGIDISGNRTKHLDELVDEPFDVVITLCDKVREVCPDFPVGVERVHWSIPDPALEGPTNRASYPAFERTAAALESRIGYLLDLLTEPISTRSATHA
jgi:protein-tyrosine-phosphatase